MILLNISAPQGHEMWTPLSVYVSTLTPICGVESICHASVGGANKIFVCSTVKSLRNIRHYGNGGSLNLVPKSINFSIFIIYDFEP